MQEATMEVGEGGSPLQEFYRGTSVFVTGGTGFMGKVLVEKLLRSCPHIDHIYLLLRPKRGMTVKDRIGSLLTSPCFANLLKCSPDIESKLVAIGGDIGTVGLGMSETDRLLLKQHVEIVFHMAATVRFNEPLKDAILQNVRGTREVLTLCRAFDKLKSLIHVSTAFSHCPRPLIAEVLYDAPINSELAIKMAETSQGDTLDQLTLNYLGKWPNTYSFSKAISEHSVQFYGQGLPVGIVRPSVVLTCAREPMPGWCDTMYGPLGFSIAMATGVAKTLYVDTDHVCNFVPCDLVNNCIIAAAWDVANRSTPLTEPPVYNCVMPQDNNTVSWRDAYNFLIRDSGEFPPSKSYWYISCFFTTSRFLTLILRQLLHFLPALVIDAVSYGPSGRTRMVDVYKKLHKFSDACFYFTSHSWQFEVSRVDRLWAKLSSIDQDTFSFDFRAIHWDSYYRTYWLGIRTFLLKDTLDSLPAAKSRTRKLYFLHRAIQGTCAVVLVWILWPLLRTFCST